MFVDNLDLLRRTRAGTIRKLRELSQEQADFRPSSTSWSAGEIADHLLLADQVFLNTLNRLVYLARTGNRAIVSSSFREVNSSIGFFPRILLPVVEVPFTVLNLFTPAFARELFAQHLMLPMQNPDIAKPRAGKPVKELIDELRVSLDTIAIVFETNPDLNYRQMRYRHPLIGDNTILGTMRILAAHEIRHQAQMSKVLDATRFPQAA